MKICDPTAKRGACTPSRGTRRRCLACAVSPDGKQSATAGQDDVVKLWDLGKGKEVRTWDLRMPCSRRAR